VALKIVAPLARTCSMTRDEWGLWRTVEADLPGDTRYLYVLDEKIERPDPASGHQPLGVHGCSQAVDHAAFPWTDGGWRGEPLERAIFYEIHVGTFTAAGTFEALIGRLQDLVELGVNALQLMPVAQFPGERNWGYDSVYPYAVQNSYGGPEGLKRLVDACHRRGLAVFLDVVYNHLGPEGNYLGCFAPYFTDGYRTPWGPAVNFDGPYSFGVRDYLIGNALHWFENFHVDGLRLDAVHGFHDRSGKPILKELAERVAEFSRRTGRRAFLIAESDLNDARLVRRPRRGGLGIDAQWNDDFHHALHTLLTSEEEGYYRDFGALGDLVKALNEGFVYDWRYSVFRKRWHGSSSADIPSSRFVVFSQSHDQVGNRAAGERLSALVGPEALKLAAAAVFFSPGIPMLFMGEEYGETAPFLYFVSHGDPGLVEAVRKGRREEFSAFLRAGDPADPQAEASFLRSKLGWDWISSERRRPLRDYYRELIRLRTTLPALRRPSKTSLEIRDDELRKTLWMARGRGRNRVLGLFSFSGATSACPAVPAGRWRKILDSTDARWLGPGPSLPPRLKGGRPLDLRPHSCTLYVKD
jgi:maltooligosyltrehalose trehalohydrolase